MNDVDCQWTYTMLPLFSYLDNLIAFCGDTVIYKMKLELVFSRLAQASLKSSFLNAT